MILDVGQASLNLGDAVLQHGEIVAQVGDITFDVLEAVVDRLELVVDAGGQISEILLHCVELVTGRGVLILKGCDSIADVLEVDLPRFTVATHHGVVAVVLALYVDDVVVVGVEGERLLTRHCDGHSVIRRALILLGDLDLGEVDLDLRTVDLVDSDRTVLVRRNVGHGLGAADVDIDFVIVVTDQRVGAVTVVANLLDVLAVKTLKFILDVLDIAFDIADVDEDVADILAVILDRTFVVGNLVSEVVKLVVCVVELLVEVVETLIVLSVLVLEIGDCLA